MKKTFTMKTINLFTYIFFSAFLLLPSHSYSQNWAPPVITGISFTPIYQDGYVPISDNSETQSTMSVNVNRSPVSSGFSYTRIAFKVILKRFGQEDKIISQEIFLEDAEFGGSFTTQKNINFNIPAKSYDGTIYLSYKYWIPSSSNWSGDILATTTFLTEPSPEDPFGTPAAWIPKILNTRPMSFFNDAVFIHTSSQPILRNDGQWIKSKDGKLGLRLTNNGCLIVTGVPSNWQFDPTQDESNIVGSWSSLTKGALGSKYECYFQLDGDLAIYEITSTERKKIWSSKSYVDPATPKGKNAKNGVFVLHNTSELRLCYPRPDADNQVHRLRFSTNSGLDDLSPNMGFLN
ncbi:hypothetical protein [Olivibacter sp. XZL3]|uniref:hypothetical protein n=1 Tax=Olivibacter sp. XZL3 TaxID=1735116 RepID=UPI00141709CE|nr:hypothetical protein [Olivibacter sp. XZL3]